MDIIAATSFQLLIVYKKKIRTNFKSTNLLMKFVFIYNFILNIHYGNDLLFQGHV